MSIDDTFQYNDINFKVVSKNACQVGYGYEAEPYTSAVDVNYPNNISIPDIAIKGTNKYIVTIISSHSFYNCYLIKSVIVPNTVIELQHSCFSLMSELREIIFQENTQLKKLGFSFIHLDYKLEVINIPATVEVINNGAFYMYPINATTNYCGKRKFTNAFNYEASKVTIHVSKQYRYKSFGNIKIIKDAKCPPIVYQTFDVGMTRKIERLCYIIIILFVSK